MKKRYKIIFGFAMLLSSFHFAFYVSANTNEEKIAELRKKIDELTRQAETYRGNVLQKQQEANTLKSQIDILSNQILRLQSDIGITQNRIVTSEIQMNDLQDQLYSTQKNIDQQKAAIAQTITSMYEYDHVDIVAALMQNPSLSDFASQTQQLSALNEKLNQLLNDLKEQKTKLESQKSAVEQKKSELEALNQRQITQKASLAGSKITQKKLLVDTKGQEAQYQKMLSETEKQEAAVFAEMQTLEQDAVHNGAIITHVTATSVPPRGTKIFSSPYHDQNFQSQEYGMTAYAKRGAYGGAGHNGIDLVSGYGSPIFSIGSGVVLASGFNNGFGNWVAIKHDAGGGMVSMYGHMIKSTVVRIGQVVTTDTVLGYEGTTGHVTGSHVHLSIYEDFFTYINPKNGQLYFNYMDGSVNPLDYMK